MSGVGVGGGVPRFVGRAEVVVAALSFAMSWRTLFTVTAPPIALEARSTVVIAPRTVPTRFRNLAALSARPVWAELVSAVTFSIRFMTSKGMQRATGPGIT